MDWFLGNEKSTSKHQKVPRYCVGKATHDYEKTIGNSSGHILTEIKKSVLCKGFPFTLTPKDLD